MAGGFDSLGLMPELLRAVDELQWYLPTDVQDEAIPLILGGGDVMVAAETGSGKTAAFCLPIIQCVHERLRASMDESKSSSHPSASSLTTHDIKLNANDKDVMFIVSPDGRSCSSNADKIWVGCRATHGVRGGRYAFEVAITGPAGSAGICRLGWASMAAHHELGKDAYGYGYGGTAMKSHANNFTAYGQKYGPGDYIGCYIDFESGSTPTISYTLNGAPLGKAFDLPANAKNTVFFPAVVLKGGQAEVNFGPFRHKILEGYKPMNNADLPHIVGAQSKEAFTVSGPKGKRQPMAVILEPARDLAEQVYNAVIDMSKYVNDPALRTVLLVGGDDFKKQQRELADSRGIDIVVGTIGKVSDLVKAKQLDLSNTKFFVLDEADRLIETENMPMIMQVYRACPIGGFGDNRLQVCFFSATLHSPAITELSTQLCQNPTWVDLKGVDSVPETVHHVVVRVDPIKDAGLLATRKTQPITDEVHNVSMNKLVGEELYSQRVKQLKLEMLLKIIDKFQMSQCIIFCRTNLDCDNLEAFLNNHGGQPGRKFTEKKDSGRENPYSCCVLAGMRSMQERRASLDAFKEGYVRFLVCTDVAARGIDIQGLPYVINMTLPDEPENYIHRIGRVGRAERMGLALSLVAGDGIKERVWYHKCSNRGKGCENRNLVDAGGCTIWYNEPALLRAVEKRLKMDTSGGIPQLTSDFDLPPEIAALGAIYGEDAKTDETQQQASLHLGMIAEEVKELAMMEIQAQNSFLTMRQQFQYSY